MLRRLPVLALVACGGGEPAGPPSDPTQLTAGPAAALGFESGPVRPVALSPDGERLFVANTPEGRLEIFRVTEAGLIAEASVAVGIDPVTVAARDDGEVWVVNHLSDSVSVVDVSRSPPAVVRTLLVGDEPRDLVFAGGRGFVATAHRGQQRTSPELAGVPGAGDPQLTTPGVGRADLWVFAVDDDRPLAIVTLPGDTPRALAVAPDGKTVYVAVFKSGNQTTVTSPLIVCPTFELAVPCTIEGTTMPGGNLGPATNHAGVPAPRVGLILKQDGDQWRDAAGRDWSAAVRFSLPDEDVFAVDVATLAPGRSYRHVGTTLFNLAVNPVSGAVYVANTEARNDLRFEGAGIYGGSTVQGHLAEARITVLDDAVRPRHLNKHIDYALRPAPAGTLEHSLASPLDLAVSADGQTLYVAAFGSGKVGVLPTAALEADSFDPRTASANYLAVSGGGPSGLAIDEARGRLYVSTRFDNGVSVIDLATRREIAHLTMATPESPTTIRGRRFLYDATRSSSNGEAACASCHPFADDDDLAWDLGDPDGDAVVTPVPIKLELGASMVDPPINGTGSITELHPMKGPMTTQTLRGLANHGAMHWRGDRVSGFFGVDTRPAPPFDAALSFRNFIVAFPGLLGRATRIADEDMNDLTGFALGLIPPPNPIRALDNSLTAAEARGRRYFLGCEGLDSLTNQPVVCENERPPPGAGHFSDGVTNRGNGFTCEGCHTLDPAQGYFGADGQFSFEMLPQTMKIPHLRNLYTKVGMFGVAANAGDNPGDNDHRGAQLRGFGFNNEGSADTLFRFLQAKVFNVGAGGRVGFFGGDPQRRDVEAYLLAFDSDLPPIAGQQVTLGPSPSASGRARLDLFLARARVPFASKVLGPGATECDLVAHAGGVAYRLRPDGWFEADDGSRPVSEPTLRARTPVTYTCLPFGWGGRILDRDGDGVANGVDACPADPACQRRAKR